MEAYEQVREKLVIVHFPLLEEFHGAADPGPPRFVVLAAIGRAHLTGLRMAGRAVVALVVVLYQDLPVRRHLVAVPGGRDELAGAVIPDYLPQIAHVLRERRRVPARVREHPPLPLYDP